MKEAMLDHFYIMKTGVKLSPDAFRGAKPYSVTWDNHERKRCLISLVTKDNWIIK